MINLIQACLWKYTKYKIHFLNKFNFINLDMNLILQQYY